MRLFDMLLYRSHYTALQKLTFEMCQQYTTGSTVVQRTVVVYSVPRYSVPFRSFEYCGGTGYRTQKSFPEQALVVMGGTLPFRRRVLTV